MSTQMPLQNLKAFVLCFVTLIYVEMLKHFLSFIFAQPYSFIITTIGLHCQKILEEIYDNSSHAEHSFHTRILVPKSVCFTS